MSENVTRLEYKGRKIKVVYRWDKDLGKRMYFTYIGRKIASPHWPCSSSLDLAITKAKAVIDREGITVTPVTKDEADRICEEGK